MNSSAAVILEDFVRPCRPNMSDKQATVISKIISLIIGVVCIVLVLFAKQFGSGLLSVSIILQLGLCFFYFTFNLNFTKKMAQLN